MKRLRAALAAAVLLGCQLQPLCAQEDSRAGPAPVPSLRLFRVTPESTLILIRVFRGGPLARLGHNHIISASRVSGTIAVNGDGGSTFTLQVPVEALQVDDPELRRSAGEGFEIQPSARDVAGTRANMLGPRVLNAAEHPLVTVSGTTEGDAAARVRFQIRGNSIEKTVLIEAVVDERSITVSGDLELSHEELGIRPFRALAGALRVQERMELSFRISAVR